MPVATAAPAVVKNVETGANSSSPATFLTQHAFPHPALGVNCSGVGTLYPTTGQTVVCSGTTAQMRPVERMVTLDSFASVKYTDQELSEDNIPLPHPSLTDSIRESYSGVSVLSPAAGHTVMRSRP